MYHIRNLRRIDIGHMDLLSCEVWHDNTKVATLQEQEDDETIINFFDDASRKAFERAAIYSLAPQYSDTPVNLAPATQGSHEPADRTTILNAVSTLSAHATDPVFKPLREMCRYGSIVLEDQDGKLYLTDQPFNDEGVAAVAAVAAQSAEFRARFGDDPEIINGLFDLPAPGSQEPTRQQEAGAQEVLELATFAPSSGGPSPGG